MTQHLTREQWLGAAVAALRPRFERAGYPIPKAVRLSCGLPSVRAFARKRAIGEAWSSLASRDKHHEIFISPTVDDPTIVLATLVHELVHVAVGLEAGHRGKFIMAGTAVGLNGPWTSTRANDELARELRGLSERLGSYPHASLEKMTNARKKQGTRLIKAGCPACGYTTRITMRWLLEAVPTCPIESCERYGEVFEVVLPEDMQPEAGGE